ncbi:MAG TPA: macro domain-containing protein [bacterium]|nr:macro domain-containing protein [bacterium]
MERHIGRVLIRTVTGDITDLDTDAIVNAANSRLEHGGGVAGAIIRKGGAAIQEESDIWVMARGEVAAGEAAITGAGGLHARYVIHSVGPRQGEGDEEEKLKNATLSSLRLAEKHHLKSIAFPAISTGVFGFPMDRCANIMVSAVAEYAAGQTEIEQVLFCLYDSRALELFDRALEKLS